jgi:type IV fimbrial biogenesis protein FimT
MTMSLITLVLTLGIPSFGNLLANHRLRIEVDHLFHAIHQARKESIVRRRAMTLCPATAERVCAETGDWSSGWMLFINKDRDWPAQRDADEPLVRYEPVDPRIRVVANRRSFTLRATELRATNGTFRFCTRSGRGKSRALIVSYTGRPRVSYEDSRGQPWECPD